MDLVKHVHIFSSFGEEDILNIYKYLFTLYTPTVLYM